MFDFCSSFINKQIRKNAIFYSLDVGLSSSKHIKVFNLSEVRKK